MSAKIHAARLGKIAALGDEIYVSDTSSDGLALQNTKYSLLGG